MLLSEPSTVNNAYGGELITEPDTVRSGGFYSSNYSSSAVGGGQSRRIGRGRGTRKRHRIALKIQNKYPQFLQKTRHNRGSHHILRHHYVLHRHRRHPRKSIRKTKSTTPQKGVLGIGVLGL